MCVLLCFRVSSWDRGQITVYEMFSVNVFTLIGGKIMSAVTFILKNFILVYNVYTSNDNVINLLILFVNYY